MPTSILYTKKSALYIRVSSVEQKKHGYSLAEQRLDLEEYAKAHGYEIVDVYADEGVSARKAISRRHELQRLLRDVKAGRIDIILMKCLDRWTRSVRDFYKVQEILDAHHVALEFSQEPDYNQTTTQGRLLLNLKLSIAQHESDTTGDRIKYVFQGMRRDKRILSGKVPYGYRIEDKKIVIDEEAADVVRFIFSRYIESNSARSLLPAIYERYGVRLSYVQVLRMLSNPAYIGRFFGEDGMAKPIIDGATFDRAQEIAKRRPRQSPRGRVWLFSGLIICPVCARRMTSRMSKKAKGDYKVYACPDRLCSYHSDVYEVKMERFLLDNIRNILSGNGYTVRTKSHEQKKSSQTLRNAVLRRERLNEIYLLGQLPKDVYLARLEAMKKEEEEIAREVHKPKPIPAILDSDRFEETYTEWTMEERRAFWQGLIREIRIDYTPGEKRNRWMPAPYRVLFF